MRIEGIAAMIRASAFLSSLCAITFLIDLASCSDDSGSAHDGGTPSDACASFAADANLTSPAVHFARDVMPIFQASCGIAGATCHGDPSVSGQGRPFLGFFDGGTDAAGVWKQLVGVGSTEDPDMNVVSAGDPTNSYMMHKIDGDQCALAKACAKGPTQYTDCGLQMPYSSEPLATAVSDTIRRWIAQGAKDD